MFSFFFNLLLNLSFDTLSLSNSYSLFLLHSIPITVFFYSNNVPFYLTLEMSEGKKKFIWLFFSYKYYSSYDKFQQTYFLNVAFNCFWHVKMDNSANIFHINAHSKRNCCYNDS